MKLALHFTLLLLLCWVIAGIWLNEKKWWPRLSKLDGGLALNRWLQEWQLLSGTGAALSSLGEIPTYKFFGHLAEAGLRHARSFGSFPRELLWEWRDGISRERNFDQRFSGIIWGALAQFSLFVVITWLFVWMSREPLELKISPWILGTMGGLQVSGVLLFAPLLYSLSKRRMRGMSELLKALYVLRALSGAGLSTSQVLKEAQLEFLPKTQLIAPLRERLHQLAILYQKQGGALGREAQMLLQEVWFLREETLGKLVKTGEALKLLFLIVFYAGAYFLYLAGLVFELVRTS